MESKEQERIARRRGQVDGVIPMNYSRRARYRQCPLWFKFEYIDRLPRVGGDAASLGLAMHKYAEARLSGAEASLPYILGSPEDTRKLASIVDDAIDAEGMGKSLAGLEEPLMDIWHERKGGKLVEVEYQAILDVLRITEDDTGIVSDWKFGWKIPTDIDSNEQLLDYALLIVKNYPRVWRVVAQQVQVRYARLLTVTFSLDRIQQHEQALRAEVVEIIQDDQYKPTPGDHCRMCPYALGHCDVGRHVLGRTRPILDDDTAREEANIILYLKAILDKREESLKSWCEDHAEDGVIDLGDKTFGWQKRNALRIPTENIGDARAVLEDHGIDSEEVIEVKYNYVTGKKFLYGRYAIPALKELAVEKPYTSFGVKAKHGRR